MKVVLFCGGMGMRLRDYSHSVPKPMVPLRYRPILWHVMKYYAHYGHKDFILCLGYKGDVIKDYFLNYNEATSNDFVLSQGGQRVELLSKDIADWRITFVDTGLNANIGERLKAAQPFLAGDDVFLANYSDGLTDCPLPNLIERFRATKAVGTFLAVRPNHSFHVATLGKHHRVEAITDVRTTGMWINGGYFVFSRAVFDQIMPGEELVVEPLQRLIQHDQLSALAYEGFWRGIDTFKDMHEMEAMVARGDGPWELWRRPPPETIAIPQPPPLPAVTPAADAPTVMPTTTLWQQGGTA